MPFKSRKQERYLQINEPEIYQDWVEKYGHFKGAESFSAEFAAEASYCSNFNDHQWIPFGSEEMSCDKCDAIVTPETIKLASEDMFAESFVSESRGHGKQKPHNYECGGCGKRVKDYKSTEASPRGTCDCPTTMMPNWLPINLDMFDAESFSAEKKSGCMHYKYGKHKWAYTQDGKICIDCGNQGVRSRDGDNSKFRSYAESFSAELKRDSCCCGATKSKPCACMIQGVMECNATCPCSLEKSAESFGADPLLDYIKQREREQNSGTVKLQGMGRMKGTKAEDVRVGDVLLWNQGGSSQVLSITPKGKKSLLWKTRTADNREWERTVRKNRLVVVSKPNSYTAKKYQAESFSAEEYEGCQHEWRTVRYGKHPTKRSQVWLCKGCNAEIDSITKPSQNRKIRPNSYTKNWRMPKQSHYFGAESFSAEHFDAVSPLDGPCKHCGHDMFTESHKSWFCDRKSGGCGVVAHFVNPFGAESFNSYKVAPDLSSYTKAELVSSIAGPQGTAAYQEVVYDPIAQSRMSAETATQRFKDYGNSLPGDSVCPACGSEDWDESFEDDEWRGYCGCGHEFSVDSAAANPLLIFYELEALKEQGTLTSDQKEYLEWTITSTLRELDSSSYTKQHIQDELVAHGWTLNRRGNAEPPKESASTLVVNAEGIDSFSPTRLMVLGASIGVALGLYRTRGD